MEFSKKGAVTSSTTDLNNNIIMNGNTDDNAPTLEGAANTDEQNEVMTKFKLGEWTVWHMAAYQDWPEESLGNLDISLLNCMER